jgi:hypothetical protein
LLQETAGSTIEPCGSMPNFFHHIDILYHELT